MEISGWRKIAIPQGIDHENLLREAFVVVLGAAGFPRDAILYASEPDSGHPNDFFFSPGATRIAHDLLQLHESIACAPPKQSEASVLVSSSGNSIALEP